MLREGKTYRYSKELGEIAPDSKTGALNVRDRRYADQEQIDKDLAIARMDRLFPYGLTNAVPNYRTTQFVDPELALDDVSEDEIDAILAADIRNDDIDPASLEHFDDDDEDGPYYN